MKSYEEIKSWIEDKDNKKKIVLGACFVLVFFVGFGAGGYQKEMRQDNNKQQSYYTTPPDKKPTVGAEGDIETVKGAAAGTASTTPASCPVKGNISSTGKKIYHVVGGAFYNRVKPEQCFNTEAEALAAGFVKSSR